MIIEKVKAAIENKINSLGYDLYSVSFKREGSDDILQIIIDKDGDITLEEVITVSNLLSEILDVEEVIPGAYLLDVTTLGAEKPIDKEKLNSYIDSYIHLHLINPINGENIYEGTLVGFENDVYTLEYRVKTRTKKIVFNKDNVLSCRLAIKF